MAGDPYPKTKQLARAERRYHRKVAGPKRWAQIAAAKQGPCRVCSTAPPNELAHLIGRAQGGHDSEWNIVPLCRLHHSLFDMRDAAVCRTICESLTDQEYAGLVEFAGEHVFERRFGIRFERAT